MARHLWLIGMMGSGKSSVGRAVAARLDIPFVDADDVVTNRLGRPIAEFWTTEGEAAFREAEAAALKDIAAGPSRVVATGGGAVLQPANVVAMKSSGAVIWLQANPKTLAARVGQNNRRPLLAGEDPEQRLGNILEERRTAYESAADAAVATNGLKLETVVDRVTELWNAY